MQLFFLDEEHRDLEQRYKDCFEIEEAKDGAKIIRLSKLYDPCVLEEYKKAILEQIAKE